MSRPQSSSSPALYRRMVLTLAAAAIAGMLTSCKSTGRGESLDSQLFATVQSEVLSDDLDHFENRGEWIDTYAKLPAACVDNFDQLDGTRALFHGCWDWHSAVHAHWAVLRADLTGAGGSRVAAAAIDSRLTTAGLARMQAELIADPGYEMPYGRAWFLRLASEHALWAAARGVSDPNRLRAAADMVAASMLAYYSQHSLDVTTTDSYHNDSWPLAQLLFWYRYTGDAAGQARVLSLIKPLETLNMSEALATDAAPVAFFSRYWGWVYLIASAEPAPRAIELIKPDSIPMASLTPVPEPATATDVHHLGINWSRAWGLKALARLVIAERGPADPTAKRLVEAYQAHVHVGRVQHEKYQYDYYSYAHWVPQFAIYAITD